jgi:epoxyqueuosine reductase
MLIESGQLILMARSLGFRRVGVTVIHDDTFAEVIAHFHDWIDRGMAGDMDYLARHADIRAEPARLLDRPSRDVRAIAVTMDYLPAASLTGWRQHHDASLADPGRAVVSVYAQGRDYHKVLRQRLVQLAARLQHEGGGSFQFRACVDSAPVLEVEIARRCGLGWRGKHTLLLNRGQGSMFFLGILLTDMPLAEMAMAADPPESTAGHCGSCTACLDACPTQAFLGPAQLDARRCISYLTIEHRGNMDEAVRPLIGNRIYGCDDCQRVCPWNQEAQPAMVDDFDVRHGLDQAGLVELFRWSEEDFESRFQGSAIRRIGHQRWLRNIAVAIGNSLRHPQCPATLREQFITALRERSDDPSPMVRHHVQWALGQGLNNGEVAEKK